MNVMLRHRSTRRLTAVVAGGFLLLTVPGGAATAGPTSAATSGVATSAGDVATSREIVRQPVAETAPGRRVVARPGIKAAAAAPTVKAAGSTSFAFVSEAGDYIGQGQSKSYKPTAGDTVTVSGNRTRLSISVDNAAGTSWWNGSLSAGVGDTLRPGKYLNAERDPFKTGRSPGLDISGEGRGCNRVYGNFTVNQISFDDSDAVTMADVSFVQRCESSTAPAFKGTIHLNQLPLSYRQASDEGDYIGGGVTKTYLNSSSLITVNGTASGLSFSVEGLRDWWSGSISAPQGTTFVIGQVYETSRFGGDGRAGLDVSGNGRGCNSSTGTVTIKKLQLSDDGAITNLSAVFEQHCEGGTPALRGTLHYFA